MDSKSVRSYADVSFGDSQSLGGISKGSRMEAKRARHLAKLKRRQENKSQTKLLFRPKVYDSWKEGDLDFDAAERERLLKDIELKERRLMERRKLRMDKGEGGSDDTDSSDEDQVIKELDKLKTRKQRQDEYRKKLEDDKRRFEEEERLEMEEKLASELQNPSVYGWYYTDGYYDNAPYFGVREDLVEKMAGEQEAFREKWAKKYPESFTAMFKRYFWPPKYLCKGKAFRTRGSYMDFPEVIADWPKMVEVNFEREVREYITNRHELFGIDEEQQEEDQRILEEALAEEALEKEEDADAKGIPLKSQMDNRFLMDFNIDADRLDSNGWYYDDEEGQFYPKKLGFDIEYYYDGTNGCWRHKKKRGRYSSENQQTPYDYYFDDSTSEFVARENYQGLDEIVYDHKTAVYRIHQISKAVRKTKSGKTAIEFPEFKGAEFEYSETGEITGFAGGGKKKCSPKAFYFDEETGKWILRSQMPEGVNTTDITWDENGKRYVRKFEGTWRGLTGMTPDDYYWSDRTRKFYPKPARQPDNFKYFSQHGVWRKTDEVNALTSLHSDDIFRFYFDEFEGQFKPKDLSQGGRTRYIQGIYSKIWRKVAKPKSNMYPDEFYWDTNKKRWLPRAIRMEMLKNAEVTRQKNIMEGQKGGGANNLFDIKKNDKDSKPEDFYFETEEGIFLKKRPMDEYYFDEVDGCFKLTAVRERPRTIRFLHEYYFDSDGQFYLKTAGGDYTYDQTFHVWKKSGLTTDLSTIDPPPSKYFYDLNTGMFKQKGSESLRYDQNLMWEVNPSSDPNFKCPDDYFFDDSDGRFHLKDEESAKHKKYSYDPTSGAWKNIDIKGPTPNALTPRSFYWDDFSRSFKLKVATTERTAYFWDPSNKIFRHVLSSGQNKSGLRPSDFVWNSEFRTYVPMSFLKRGKAPVVDNLPKWDPMRLYEKPWQPDDPNPNTTLPSTSSKGAATPNAGGTAPAKAGETATAKPGGTAPDKPGETVTAKPSGTAKAGGAVAAKSSGTAPAKPGGVVAAKPSGTAPAKPGGTTTAEGRGNKVAPESNNLMDDDDKKKKKKK